MLAIISHTKQLPLCWWTEHSFHLSLSHKQTHGEKHKLKATHKTDVHHSNLSSDTAAFDTTLCWHICENRLDEDSGGLHFYLTKTYSQVYKNMNFQGCKCSDPIFKNKQCHQWRLRYSGNSSILVELLVDLFLQESVTPFNTYALLSIQSFPTFIPRQWWTHFVASIFKVRGQ